MYALLVDRLDDQTQQLKDSRFFITFERIDGGGYRNFVLLRMISWRYAIEIISAMDILMTIVIVSSCGRSGFHENEIPK